MIAQWNEYQYFNKSELDCKFTGENNMQHEFMLILEAIREEYNKSMRVTSGFRSKKHPIEAKKLHSKGEHVQGLCADIACTNSNDRFDLIKISLNHGITRIGVAKNFLHLGLGNSNLPKNVIWFYD